MSQGTEVWRIVVQWGLRRLRRLGRHGINSDRPRPKLELSQFLNLNSEIEPELEFVYLLFNPNPNPTHYQPRLNPIYSNSFKSTPIHNSLKIIPVRLNFDPPPPLLLTASHRKSRSHPPSNLQLKIHLHLYLHLQNFNTLDFHHIILYYIINALHYTTHFTFLVSSVHHLFNPSGMHLNTWTPETSGNIRNIIPYIVHYALY